jgi:integrase
MAQHESELLQAAERILESAGERHRKIVQNCRRFQSVMGVLPIAQIDAAAIELFKDEGIRQEYTAETVRQTVMSVKTVVETVTRKRITVKAICAPEIADRHTPASSRTLDEYFEEHFRPEVLKGVKRDTVYAYRKAVRRFISWSGCNIQIHCVTDGILDRFVRAMVIDGMTLKNARAYRVYLRRITRHRYPEKCLKTVGKRPHEEKPTVINGLSEPELDIEGSLFRFYRTEYIPRRMIGSKAVSINVIRYTIVRFAKFLGRVPMVTDLNDAQVSEFLNWLLNVAELAVASVNGSRGHLLALWRYAVKRRLLNVLPSDVDKLKEPKRLPSAWTIDELALIIEAAKQCRSRRTGGVYPSHTFFPALILVGYNTGLRLRALLGIQLSGWDADRREITVDAEYMKHRVAQTFSVSEQAAEAIETMLESSLTPDEIPAFLFPWPVGKEAIWETYRNIVKEAGLWKSSKDSFHKLRRTTASHLTAKLGIESACRQLGHSSVEMTRRYVDPRLTSEHRAADHLPTVRRKG